MCKHVHIYLLDLLSVVQMLLNVSKRLPGMPDYAIVAGVGRDRQSEDLQGHQRVLCLPACLSTGLSTVSRVVG